MCNLRFTYKSFKIIYNSADEYIERNLKIALRYWRGSSITIVLETWPPVSDPCILCIQPKSDFLLLRWLYISHLFKIILGWVNWMFPCCFDWAKLIFTFISHWYYYTSIIWLCSVLSYFSHVEWMQLSPKYLKPAQTVLIKYLKQVFIHTYNFKMLQFCGHLKSIAFLKN